MAKCNHIAIENHVGYMNTHWRKPDQIIHPYWFGHNADKRTCLWLKNLPQLKPTNIVDKPEKVYYPSGTSCGKWYVDTSKISKKERQKARSKTFTGIAKAMAEQWAGECQRGE